MLVVHDFMYRGLIKQLPFTIVTRVQNVHLPSALYIFLLSLQGNGHGMKIVLVIDICGHFKVVTNYVLTFVLINKALNVSLHLEVKVVEAR